MTVIRDQIAGMVTEAIRKAQRHGELPKFDVPLVDVGRPKDASNGDYSTAVAMQSARFARMAPILIAEAISKRFGEASFLGSVEVAAPGFINFRLDERWLAQRVVEIESMTDHFGDVDLGHGQRCQVEFISANPTGPLHMGSARNAVLGDALASVLEASGYQVQREYYVNDAGTQMRTFAETLYRRYLQALGQDAPLESHHYQGAYVVTAAAEIVAEHGAQFRGLPQEQAIEAIGGIGLEKMLVSIRRSAEAMRIHFDNWFSERSLYDDGKFETVMAALRAANLTEFRDGAVWLRTSAFGSDRDEVLIRSDGRPGYYASDVVYHYDKFVLRGFDRVIDVWAVDHQNQARRMPHLMRALDLDPQRLTIVLYDLVRLYRDGQEVKLSKRSGDIITVDEVLDEVGADAVRFLLLTRSKDSVMDFDLNLAVQQNDDNPVFYVQYAHARMASILRAAAERGIASTDWSGGDIALLTHDSEMALLRKIIELSEVIEKAALQLSPHHLAFYAQELATSFHAFYRDCRVLSSEPDDAALTLARLRLLDATKSVFARVLGLMGMRAPESM